VPTSPCAVEQRWFHLAERDPKTGLLASADHPATGQDANSRFLFELRIVGDQWNYRVDKLDRPNGNDGKLAQQWIDELRDESDQIDDALGDLQKALKDRDPNAIRAAGQKLQQLDNKRFTELSKQLGMSSCAS